MKAEEIAAAGAAPTTIAKKRMSLRSQMLWLNDLRLRCRIDGKDASISFIDLTQDDLATLDCIIETMDLFDIYGADKFVRERIERRRGR